MSGLAAVVPLSLSGYLMFATTQRRLCLLSILLLSFFILRETLWFSVCVISSPNGAVFVSLGIACHC